LALGKILADPFITFNWCFADVYKRDGARFHALEARKAETFVLMNLVEAHSLINFALWSELPKNHPVGELWLETQTDLEDSIYLAYGGFFRQALAIIRFWFEIAVHAFIFQDIIFKKTLVITNGGAENEKLLQTWIRLPGLWHIGKT